MLDTSAKIIRSLVILTLGVTLSACTNSDDSGETDLDGLALDQRIIEAPILADGTIVASFELQAGQTAMQLVAETPLRTLRVIGVAGPSGEILFDAADRYDVASTTAAASQPKVNVLNLPVVGKDDLKDLSAGTYSVQYLSELIPNANATGEEVDSFSLMVVSKEDGDITSGTIPLKVIVPSSLADSPYGLEAIENSLDAAHEILARGGLNLTYDIVRDATVPGTLPNPYAGDEMYRRYSEANSGQIVMFVGVQVRNLQTPLNPIGQAGSNPGALAPSPRSAIAISYNAAAGGDGVIDSQDDRNDLTHTSEVRLMAEAMAHEILHYLGLQDTLVFEGNVAVATDVTDSPKCPTLDTCRLDADAPHNIMFPYPLDRNNENGFRPASQDDLIPREYLSTLQQVIAQLAIGVE